MSSVQESFAKKSLVVLIVMFLVAALGSPAEAAGKKKFKVSIKVSQPTIYSGQTVTISGKVSPRAAGRKVRIQKKLSTSSKWTTEGRAKIRANGTYSFTDKPTSLKWRLYRVYKPKQGKRKAGYSKARKVVVKKPVQRPAAITITSTGPTVIDAGQQFVLNGTTSSNLRGGRVQLQINGVTYGKTVYSYWYDDTAQWDLARKCTRFRAVAGITDNSDAAVKRHAYVKADSLTRWSRTNATLGSSWAVDVDVASALRLRLDVTAVAEDGRFGFGDARIRCAF